LHIVLRGVEKSFDSFEARPRKRTIKSLLYCQEEVEAQYAEWIEARVGSSTSVPEIDPDKTPFSVAAITEHLMRCRSSLVALASSRPEDDLSEALARAAALLAEIENDFAGDATLDTRKLEDSLTGLERMLNDAMLSVVNTALDEVKKEIRDQLKPYRALMETAVYNQTFNNLLLKRLREQFGVPRLSLFYV
jgi:hypothetical protein